MLAWPRGVITDVHAVFFSPSACPPCCHWQNQKPFCVSEPEMQRRPRGQAWKERAGSGSCGVEGDVPWCVCVGWGDAAAGRTGLSPCCWVIVRTGDEGCAWHTPGYNYFTIFWQQDVHRLLLGDECAYVQGGVRLAPAGERGPSRGFLRERKLKVIHLLCWGEGPSLPFLLSGPL